MKRLFFVLSLVAVVSCGKENTPDNLELPTKCETFDAPFDGDYKLGYETDDFTFEHFYNEEYQYWGGFAQSKVYDKDVANGKFENQYAAYNDKAASGEGFLLYYYDSYNEPCDIRFNAYTFLRSVKLNLTTYTYASITDEDINTFARKFDEGDYLKVVFTSMHYDEPSMTSVECYVVDYRDGKRFIADDWNTFSLEGISGYGVRVSIETSDVGEYGANTPLYICLDDLTYAVWSDNK